MRKYSLVTVGSRASRGNDRFRCIEFAIELLDLKLDSGDLLFQLLRFARYGIGLFTEQSHGLLLHNQRDNYKRAADRDRNRPRQRKTEPAQICKTLPVQ